MTDQEVVWILGEPTSVEQMADRPGDGFMWNYVGAVIVEALTVLNSWCPHPLDRL